MLCPGSLPAGDSNAVTLLAYAFPPGARRKTEISALLRISGAGAEQAQVCPAIPAGAAASEEQHGTGSTAIAARPLERASPGSRGDRVELDVTTKLLPRHLCLIKPEVLEVSAASKPGLTPPAKSPVLRL